MQSPDTFRNQFGTALLAFMVVALLASTSFAQFEVRELGENGEVSFDLNNHWEFYNLLTSPNDLKQYETFGGIVEEAIEFDFINTGQAGSGRFGDVEFFEPGIGGDDWGMDARAEVTIPPGTWSIGFGSDDGGQLTLQTTNGDTVAFDSTFNTNGVGNFRIRNAPNNQLWFLGNRGHNWTGGTFTVTEETTATFHASFHERGGGDNWEVAIAEGPSSNPQNNGTWDLLGDGVLGWAISPTSDLPEFSPDRLPLPRAGASPTVRIAQNGIQQSIVPVAGAVIQTTGDGTDPTTGGLNVVFADGNNTGNLFGNLNHLLNNETVAAGVVYPNWTGSNPADLGGEWVDGVKYPEAVATVAADVFGESEENIDEYVAWSSGEINLAAGVTKFRLGVDDYRYLAIDSGGNGIAGDQPGEVLLNHNGWVNPFGVRGGGDGDLGNSADSRFAAVDVPEAGWYAIDIIMSEGGGGDAQTLYWDEGNEEFFPELLSLSSTNNVALADEGLTAENFLVPGDSLRSVQRGEIESVSLVSALAGAEVVIDISSDIVDADHVVLENDNFDTEINLAGATVILNNVGGDLRFGDSFVPFLADTISGGEDAIYIYPEGTTAFDWMNEIEMGTGNRITFAHGDPLPIDNNNDGQLDAGDLLLACANGNLDFLLDNLGVVRGDVDGEDGVAFADFLVLSTNFGREDGVGYTDGDLNCSGAVDFADFLVLSTNFGQDVAAASAVPEPAGASLFAIALAFAGLVRRRKQLKVAN